MGKAVGTDKKISVSSKEKVDTMKIIDRIKFKLFPRLISSREYVAYLHEKGIDVGEGTYFFGPSDTVVDIQRPWMLKIGKYCKITAGVVILCHDYSRSVLRMKYGDVIGEAKPTKIGDNVFIGTNSIILMGSEIGNNVIIGAGSVVSGKVPSDSVCCGNPARVIRNLDEHYSKRKSSTMYEAKDWVNSFFAHYGRYPSEQEMGPFWQLFMPRSINELKSKNINTIVNGDNRDDMLQSFLKTKATFESYESFISWCKADNECG